MEYRINFLYHLCFAYSKHLVYGDRFLRVLFGYLGGYSDDKSGQSGFDFGQHNDLPREQRHVQRCGSSGIFMEHRKHCSEHCGFTGGKFHIHCMAYRCFIFLQRAGHRVRKCFTSPGGSGHFRNGLCRTSCNPDRFGRRQLCVEQRVHGSIHTGCFQHHE